MSKYIGTPVVNLSVDTVDVSGDITATDSTPELILLNDTHEDTDGGREGKITFKGEQSGGEVTVLAQIQSGHDGTSDDEKGDLIFKTNDGSDGASPTEAMRIASDQKVGIGTNSGTGKLTVQDSSLPKIQANYNGAAHLESGVGGSGCGFSMTTGHFMTFNHQPYANAGSDTNLTERMRIDSSGNVGIGTNNPLYRLVVKVDSGGSNLRLENGSETAFFRLEDNGDLNFWAHGSESIIFTNGTGSGTENARIDDNGNLLVGTSSTFDSADASNGSADKFGFIGGRLDVERNSSAAAAFKRTSSNGTLVHLCRGGSGAVGSISVDTGAAAFNTSSDHRLKENVEILSNGITRVKQLNPKRFSWIVDEEDSASRDGFLAHEAQTVVSEAVYGTKDEVEVWAEGEELPDGVSVGDNKLDDNGKTIPVMQGIDQSKLVPLLTAALQEAIAKIETLETKVAALEGE